MKLMRNTFLQINDALYQFLANHLLFPRLSAQEAHEKLLKLLAHADANPVLLATANFANKVAFELEPVQVGGVWLNTPLILAAGFVKGEGFDSEEDALKAVETSVNIIPGWRVIPNLMGPIEFGSFTRYPRCGNSGEVVWRDLPTQSTQNRVGLRNPGVVAAAQFLAKHHQQLPEQFGINIAVSPGVVELEKQVHEVRECFAAFLKQGVIPCWFTLNLSCPNTDDDPGANQTESLARILCETIIDLLNEHEVETPLWVKLSPALALEQYRVLMRVFHHVGVKAVVTTNTLPAPSPNQPNQIAGIGGGKLHEEVLTAIHHLRMEKLALGSHVDIVGCGGLMDGRTYQNFLDQDVRIIQYWSALVFRGPLAPAIIRNEQKKYERDTGSRRPGFVTN